MSKLSYKSLLIIFFSLLIGVIVLAKFVLPKNKVSAAWWNDGWHYRQSINISSHTSLESNVFITTTINIDSTAKTQSDDGDFRFIDNNGNLLDYYLISGVGTTSITFHILIPSFPSGASTIYTYYNNSTADDGFSTSDFPTEASNYTIGSLSTEEVGGGPIAYWKFDNDLLPNNYTPVEYVTINNDSINGYLNSINTNTLFNNATKIEFTINSTDTVGNIVLVSGYSSSTTRAYPCVLGSSYIAPSSFTTATLTPSNITRSQVSDGTIRTFTLNFNTSSTNPISFGSWQDSSWSRTINWYSFKIWNGNIMVKNFVPAKRNSDSVFGFYDTINNVFYTNAGTSSFTGGNEIIYDSIGINNGTLGTGNSAPTWSDESQCISGKCLSFNGAQSAFSNYDASWNNSNSISISFWVKPQNITDTNRGILGKKYANYEWSFYQAGNAVSFVYWNNTGGHTNGMDDSWGNVLTANNWTHLVYSWDGSISKFYANGKLVKTKTATNPSINMNQTNNMMFGGNIYTWGDSYFRGFIDDVKIYPYASTSDQIKLDYNSRGSLSGSTANLGIQSSTVPDLNSKLIAYYKFDEGNGTSFHDSINNYVAGVSSSTAPTWENNNQCYKGKCLLFNGINNEISLGNGSSLDFSTGDFTISTWVNQTSTANNRKIIFKGNPFCDTCTGGYTLFTQAGVPRFAVNLTTASGDSYSTYNNSSTINDGKWHFITGQRSGDIIKLFVDGKIISTTNLPTGSTIVDSGSYFYISGSSYSYEGSIDELKIYNTALTDEEVKQDYNQGSAISFGSTTQTIGSTTTSLEYCIPGDTSYCASPVAEWKMDEGLGTSIVDTSGNNNTGTISGATWNQGKIGKSLSFNGTNNYITIPTYSYTTNATISVWVKGSYTNGNQIIVGSPNSIALGLYNSGSDKALIGSSISGKAVGISNNFINDSWNHLTVVFDNSGNATYYCNGQFLTNSGTNSWTWSSGGYIGRRDSGSYFKGQIDQLKIYNYARTPAQIAYDYNKGAPIGWWKMDECQGNTVYDWSGNNNNGTINIGSGGSQNSLGTCQIGTSAAWTNGATGKLNSSLNFDGVNDYVNLGNINIGNTTNNISVSVWIYPKEYKYAEIFRKSYSSGYSWSYKWRVASENLYFALQDTSGSYHNLSFNPKPNLNEWTHLTATYDGTTGKAYKNGKLISSFNSSFNIRYDNNPVYIGSGGGNEYFNGQIDDVRIYNYALTSEQVKQLYNGGSVSFN